MFVLCHPCRGVSDSGSGTPRLSDPPSSAPAARSFYQLASELRRGGSLLACQGESHPEYRSCWGSPAPRGCCADPKEHPWDRIRGRALGAEAWAGEVGVSGGLPAAGEGGKLPDNSQEAVTCHVDCRCRDGAHMPRATRK